MQLHDVFGTKSDLELIQFIRENPNLEKSKELIEILNREGIKTEDLQICGGGNVKDDGITITGAYQMTINELIENSFAQSLRNQYRDITGFIASAKAAVWDYPEVLDADNEEAEM